MKLRKLLVLALVLALFVCAFAACGDGTDTETNLPETDSETDAPVSDTEDPGKETEDPGKETEDPGKETEDPEKECTHELEVEEKLATCTDRGYKKEVCKLCGETVSETAYPKAAHTPVAAATCTEDSKCSACGVVLEAAKGHTFGDAVVVDATCLADGSKTQTCSTCNETVVEKIPALAHDIQKVTASTAATCTTEGSKTGICALCNTEQTVTVPAAHTIKSLGDLTALIFVDGKLQATCSTCKTAVDVAGDLRLALTFDEADVPTELAKWDGFAYGLTYNPDQASTVKYPPVIAQYADAADGHTSVLSVPHNSSAAIQFGGSLLSDSDYYVISFDWRATKFDHTTNKIGGFGQADTSTLDTGAADGSYVYAFRVDRSNGELYNGASKEKFSFAAEAGHWYHIDIVVDHESGTAYTYFDGVCVATLANAKWIVAEDGTYTWRFGGVYNAYHKPEFDNFTVVTINKSESSAVVDPDSGEEGGDPEDDGTGCDHECYLEVQLPTPEVPGFIKRTCNICGRVVTYEILEHICSSETPADCVTDSYCDECGELIEAAWGHVLDENQPVTDTLGAIPCVDKGRRDGFCVVCQQAARVDLDPIAHTFKIADIDFDDVTFDENGNILLPCTVCGNTHVVGTTDKFALDWDNGSSTGANFTSGSGGNATEVVGGRLFMPGNTSSLYTFDTSLLEGEDIYVISFDYRRTSTDTSKSDVHGIFGVATLNASDGTVVNGYKLALKIQRGTFKYATASGNALGAASNTISDTIATNGNVLDKIVIIVDNTTGHSYVYINGVFTFHNENNNMLISSDILGAGETFAWRFGGQYGLNLGNEWDNFKVVALNAECRHTSTILVEDTAATCIAEGLDNIVCDKCRVIVDTQPSPMVDHVPGEVTDADYADCAYKAKCAVCSVEMLFAKENAEHVLSANASTTVVGDTVYGECKNCGIQNVPGSASDLMVLNFDKDDVATELEALPNAATLGFAYGTVYGGGLDETPVCVVSTIGQRTVLLVSPQSTTNTSTYGNHTPLFKFNGDMLKDTPYYVVSFDVQYVGSGIGSTNDPNMTLFGLYQLTSNEMPSGDKTLVSVPNSALVANRVKNQLAILNADLSASKSVTNGTWYTVTLIVDNATGNSDIYIDGTYLGNNTNGKMLVEAGKDYVWVLGGQYVNQHRPAFDNFRVYALGYECVHTIKNTVTVTDSTCTTEGTTKLVCSACGVDCGVGENIPVKPHTASDVVVEDKSCYTVYACTGAADGCTEKVKVAKENATHNVAAPTKVDATTVIKNGVVQGTCTVCGLEADSSMTVENRLVLDFDQIDLATEIAALNEANAGLNLSATNADAYEYVNSTLQCKSAQIFYLTHSGSILKDATYYVISFDWRWTYVQDGGFINTFGTATSTSNLGTSFAYYARTAKTMVDDDVETANVLLDNITKDTWYAFDIFVNNATGEAFVYINDTYVQTVQADSLMVEEGDTCYWSLNGASSGHKPQWDNFKIQKLGIACEHGTFNIVTETEATCVALGTTKKVCKICGEDLGPGDPIPMKDHEASANVKEDKSCCTVYACTGEADGCTATVTVAKKGATHTVSAPTSVGSTSVVIDGKVCGTCSVCGLDTPVPAGDVVFELNFDKGSLADEFTALNNSKVSYYVTSDGDGAFAATKEVDGRTVLYSRKGAAFYVGYDLSLLSDATYFTISFDYKVANVNTGYSGQLGIFAAVPGISTTDGKVISGKSCPYSNIARYDQAKNAFINNAKNATLMSNVEEDKWYTFTLVVDNTFTAEGNVVGRAHLFIDGEYMCSLNNFGVSQYMLDNYGSLCWRFGENYNSHNPHYDNFKVQVIK